MSDQTPPDDFERLLNWLASDREAAGRKYEEIRRTLHNYFRRREVADPLSLVDEVIERVTCKVAEVAPGFVGEPSHYFLAVARRVLAEWQRRPIEKELPLNVIDSNDSITHKELLLQSLEECWAKRTPREQSILYRYCVETPPFKLSEARDELAGELEMSLTALRVMVHRLKKTIRRCIERLMAQKA